MLKSTIIVLATLIGLAGCNSSVKVINASFGKVTLTQDACKSEVAGQVADMLGLPKSKMKAGALDANDGRGHIALCYLDAKDSPTERRFIVDELGGMGNFDPDVKK